MERLVSQFTLYEIGKMSALYQSNEQFKRCDGLMRRINKYHPGIDSFLMGMVNYDSAGNPLKDAYGKYVMTNFEINRRVIFSCYLVSRTAYQNLEAVGRKDIADAVDRISQGVETAQRKAA